MVCLNRGGKPWVRPLVILGAVGIGTASVCALVFRRSEYSVSMHPDDWPGMELEDAHRRYRGLGQALHHLKEAAGLAGPRRVYLRQAISPVFREQIMLTTAISDNCPI